MNRLEKVKTLNQYLLTEMPEYISGSKHFPDDLESQRRLLRSLMNIRYPQRKLNADFLKLQDELLSEELKEKGIVHIEGIPTVKEDCPICIWQGDMVHGKMK